MALFSQEALKLLGLTSEKERALGWTRPRARESVCERERDKAFVVFIKFYTCFVWRNKSGTNVD